MSSSNNDHSFDLKELQWDDVKDSDFFRFIKISVEDIYKGRQCDVIVRREIREIDKKRTRI